MIKQFTDENFFLSNFYEPAPVEYEGELYPTSEHAYQAAKSLDPDVRRRIRDADGPGKAKKMGRPVERGGIVVLRDGWDNIKDQVMLDICRIKFSDPELRQLLLDTGDEELVEGNWWGDTYWGVCKGVGENKLGKTLMKIRNEIRREQG